MYYYKYKNKYLCSLKEEYKYEKIAFLDIPENIETIYFLNRIKQLNSKHCYAVSTMQDFYVDKEDEKLFCKDLKLKHLELENLLKKFNVKGVNTIYSNYEEQFNIEKKKKYKINLLALGDVGSTLLIGLRLLGKDIISEIGIFDINENMMNRWFCELNQIAAPFEYMDYPEVKICSKDNLFDCDMFLFCASMGVPEVGSNVGDVRMIQLEKNKKLIEIYANMAKDSNFEGIFSVISDPVDPLCNHVLEVSNLKPEKIKGYGLGVMNARANFYAKQYKELENYGYEGRAFGPHGKDLIIANSIENYDEQLSLKLTKLTIEANLRIRDLGFKPYVAPALSSGAISIIETLKGNWNYSSVCIGGKYFGCKNRITSRGIEIERIDMPKQLLERIRTVLYK